MDLMRFQAKRPETGTPGPTPPPSKSGGGGLAVAYMYLPPPWGGGKKAKRPFTPRENLG